MNKALFGALASVALLGASCSVQDFSTVVMDKPTIMASFLDAPKGAIGEQDITRYYGKYSFRYGYLGSNIVDSVMTPGAITGSTGAFTSFSVSSDGYPLATSYLRVKPSTHYVTNAIGGWSGGYGLAIYDSSQNYLLGYGSGLSGGVNPLYSSFTTPSNAYYLRYSFYLAPDSFNTSDYLFITEGSSLVYGFSFDTPVTGVGSSVMDMEFREGGLFPRNPSFAYNYNDECILYSDGYNFDFGGNSALQDRFLAEWLGAFASGTNRGFDWDNDYDDDYLVMIPLVDDYAEGAYCEFYIQDRYQAGYEDGYLASSAYEIIKELSRFEFVYYTGTGDDEESHSIVKTDTDARDYLAPYVINGLLSVRSVVADLTDDVSGAHDIVMRFKYSEGKTIEAAPLYIDFEAFTALVAQEFRTHLALFSTRVQVPWYVFNADLEVSYQGNLKNYGGGMLSDRYSAYTDIQINYPMPDVGGRLNYIGILSGYSQGYADAMTESGEEIDDLTQRILDLQEDLEQYQGKTYQQIYNLGVQAGLDENAQGAATFNSLFGNILTAPLTILNGLTDISFFGMPILTAILSLLMVAMALFLFKRFK